MLLIAGLRISALSQPSTGFLPRPIAILLTPGPTPPHSVLICRPPPPPSTLPPYAPSSLLPFPLFIPTRAFWTLPATTPVNHTLHFGSPSTAYTGSVIHCLPPCPFRPSSVLQTNVGTWLLIPSTFYPPPPPPRMLDWVPAPAASHVGRGTSPLACLFLPLFLSWHQHANIIVLLHNYFPLAWAARTTDISL